LQNLGIMTFTNAIKLFLSGIVGFALWFLLKPSARFITLASTTSTEDSGLLKAIIPQFTAKTGVEVRVVAVGTGQAFKIAQSGDADVLLVHDRQGEDAFIANGYGTDRRDVMANDFVLLGTQPFSGLSNITTTFVSRGDDSGTHRKEMALWGAAGINPIGKSWYKEVGSGMGATLNTAQAMNAYVLSDRATWAAFAGKKLKIVWENAPELQNPYGSILVKGAKPDAKLWHEWLTSTEGKAAINAFKVNGVQLFFMK
jgi:tungstate transport system substrate-binding protein